MAETALVEEAATRSAAGRELVSWMLGGVEFALPIEKVREIVRLLDVTPVPGAPAYVRGVANLRGTLLPVIDPRIRFALRGDGEGEATRIIVAELESGLVGLLVDGLREVIRVDATQIEPAPAVVQGVNRDLLEGVVKLDEGRRLILMLRPEKILEAHVARQAEQWGDSAGTGSQDSSAVSQHEQQEGAESQHQQLVVFNLGECEYAIPITQVREIIRVPQITPVPQAPEAIVGVTSLRNELLAVMSLKRKLGLASGPDDGGKRVLVAELPGRRLGLLVDAVSEVLFVQADCIEETPEMARAAGRNDALCGIANLQDGRRLITLIDPNALVDEAALEAISRSAESQVEGTGDHDQRDVDEQTGDSSQMVVFRLSDVECACDIAYVQEIVRMCRITPIPQAPEWVRGVVNLRGTVLPVLDLKKRLGMESQGDDSAARIVVLDVEQRQIGLIVDGVSEVLSVGRDCLEPPPDCFDGRVEGRFLQAIAKLDEGRRVVLMLDVSRLSATQDNQ